MRVLKVLIAEDDLMIGDLTGDVLVEQGYEVCGIARTVAEAVVLAWRHKPDLAVIDLRLAEGGLGTEIVAQLAGDFGTLGILYATAHVGQVMQNAAGGHACLAKPYSPANLLRSLEIVTEMVARGTASLPFPLGFKVLPSAATAVGAPLY
jgi:two-component system, response regulator PdtaR